MKLVKILAFALILGGISTQTATAQSATTDKMAKSDKMMKDDKMKPQKQ